MTDQIRDRRHPGHFWADNEIVDDYLPAIGAHGFAVYMLLCRYARDGQADPSISKMAAKLGVSEPTVRKGITALEEVHLIKVTRDRIDQHGDPTTHLYEIIAVKRGGGKSDLPPPVKDVYHPGQPDLPGVVKDVYPLKNKKENTQNKKEETPKPPLVVESRSSNGEFENSEIQIGVSTVDPGRALEPSPPVSPPPSPFDLEMELVLLALVKVTGMDWRLFPEVHEKARDLRKCGYVAEDVAAAQIYCMDNDWKWIDPKRGHKGRMMDLNDVTKYIGVIKVRSNSFKYDPEMQLGSIISRAREAGDMAAIDAGWQPALPAEVDSNG